MGVPKFFRYISERYPCLSELARERYIPEFDNLYLDMNGIIHNCSHPDDSNIHFNITEEEMFKDIFNYIDKLFFLIKPQKLFFMAIDGVAPRAKMNQQRSRRFRTAKEAETLEKLAENRGETRDHERFDSNCITPGTEFMARLHEALRYFIKSKISADPIWQKCRVILSGHNSPGEGEHKIMDYIRYLKSQSDFNPNTRHCLYGLDADLIILGLCTHELNFVVLREEVKFSKKAKKTSVEETRFFLLHLSLLREYLELEFCELKEQDPNFDIANLIDDWILMGFLVGNDFIPHLPFLHISSNALPLLYKTYKIVYGSLGGNINENGKLNLLRLEKYFAALAEVEFEIFQEHHADLKYFEAKQSKNGIEEAFDFDVNEIDNENLDNDLANLIESSRQFLEEDDDYSSDSDQHINDEFENYKRNYYMNKLNKDHSNSEHKKEQTFCYITALQWILDYYYRGVQSWDWYYPYHYAPFISDLKDFKDYKITFNMGKPFLPFQQLLAVLPAASKNILPAAYWDLMVNPNSELIKYYPENFQTDLNGKQHEWEAVVLIPFIDEKKLLEAMAACDKNLTPSELERNQHGPMLQYDFHPESQEEVPGIYNLKSLIHVFCTEKPFWCKDILVSPHKTVCVELPRANRTDYFPGFPSMKHLKYKFEIKNARVKIFDYASRNDNMILKPESRKNMDDVFAVAEKFLNQNVYIGWPYLIKAKVVAVSNKEKRIDIDGIKDCDPKIFDMQVKSAQEHLNTRMGIEFEDYSVLVHVRIYLGTTYTCGSRGKVFINDEFNSIITNYPAQGVVTNIAVHNSLAVQHKKIEQLFPESSKIFFIGNPYYGSEGVVMNPMLVHECGRLKVNITVLPEPDFTEAKLIQDALGNNYYNLFASSAQIGINIKCLQRITGSVLVVKGARRPKCNLPENLSKLNIGLQFKYIKQQEELSGYARLIDNQWLFSSKAISLVQSYAEKFPVVIEYLSNTLNRAELLFEQDLFPLQVGEKKVDEIVAWLKVQDHMKAERVTCGSKTLEKESVQKVLESIEHLKTLPVKTVKLQVKPHLLLKPDVTLPATYKPKSTVRLFDRVVIVRTTYMVPLGAKGTVIGTFPVTDKNPVRLECVKAVDKFYEILFDKHIPNANEVHGIAKERVYKVPESSLLLITTQDNKNETSYNSKILNHVQNNQNASTKSWRSQTTAESFNNSSCSNSWRENSDVKTEVVQQGGSDFWIPAANMKMKHSNTLQVMQNPNQIETDQRSMSSSIDRSINKTASIQPQQCNDGTQLLKSLLGLSANQSEAPLTTKPQLPQPPTSWLLADARKTPFIPCNFYHAPQSSSAPVASNAGYVFPLQTEQHAVPKYQEPHQFHQWGSQTTEERSYFPTSAEQNLCHDKKFNLNSLNQKGAFIPLQVSRGNFRKISPTPTSSNMQNDSLLHKDIVTQNFNNLFLHGVGNTTTTDEIQLKPMYGRMKPPRVSKIGAKFDNAQ